MQTLLRRLLTAAMLLVLGAPLGLSQEPNIVDPIVQSWRQGEAVELNSFHGAMQQVQLPALRQALMRGMILSELTRDAKNWPVLRAEMASLYPDQDLSFVEKENLASSAAASAALTQQLNVIGLAAASAQLQRSGGYIADLDLSKLAPIEIADGEGSGEMETVAVKEQIQELVQKELSPAEKAKLAFLEQLKPVLDRVSSGETSALMDLSKISLSTEDKMLRTAIIHTCALGFFKDDGSLLQKYAEAVKARFPKDDINHFAFVESTDFKAECTDCGSTGSSDGPCNVCNGASKCPNKKCKGGTISYRGLNGDMIQKECPVCKGTGECDKCTGTGKITVRCKTCSGKGFKFSRAKAPELFSTALQELTRLVDEMIVLGAPKEEYVTKEVTRFVKKERVTPLKPKPQKETEQAKADDKSSSGSAFSITPEDMTKMSEDDGYTPAFLHLILKEVDQYIRAQEQRSKSSLVTRSSCQWRDGAYILIFVIPDSAKGGRFDDIANGYLEFWKMRLKSNGFREDGATVILKDQDGKVLVTKKN